MGRGDQTDGEEPRMVEGVRDEVVLYDAHPAMFRNRPIFFVLGILTIPIVVGLVGLIWWYLDSRSTTLTVTDRWTRLRRGLLSRDLSTVFHDDVRNVRVAQTFFQRLMGVGYVGISTAGQSGVEIEAHGMPDPVQIKEIIDRYRRGEPGSPRRPGD
jgi:uncharacterized membrane protein YdbT with pleckstrin-like domain